MNNVVNGWEMVPADVDFNSGIFMEENWMNRESPLINTEQQIIYNMLKLFIPGDYGYYFSEIHEHDKPEEIPQGKDLWSTVYYTPSDFYYRSGEYNIIHTASTEDYTYYAISLHGCHFSAALTEYVRVSKND
tara:strand:- start:479 stop:874 length:396 start_codon:yes stop_codon:yes gene_type:complete